MDTVYAVERLATEWWKAIVREQDQSHYTIPMRLGVRGRPVDHPFPRYTVGVAVAGTTIAGFLGRRNATRASSHPHGVVDHNRRFRRRVGHRGRRGLEKTRPSKASGSVEAGDSVFLRDSVVDRGAGCGKSQDDQRAHARGDCKACVRRDVARERCQATKPGRMRTSVTCGLAPGQVEAVLVAAHNIRRSAFWRDVVDRLPLLGTYEPFASGGLGRAGCLRFPPADAHTLNPNA